MSAGFDDLEVRALHADLGRATHKITVQAQKATEVSARNIKDDARELASGIGHAPQYPRSINYEMTYGLQQIRADIGPDKGGPQGALGNILEYGSMNNAPIPHLGPALQKNEADWVDHILGVGDIL